MHTNPIPNSTLDRILTAQLAVAWAGEAGEERRLGWWRTDLVSEFGGEDLFRRLLPGTWRWAVLQGAREAARRHDAARRSQEHDADRILSLFHLGAELDERLEERLRDLKRTGKAPTDVLSGLREVISEDWDQSAFAAWVSTHGEVGTVAAPAGRRLRGEAPGSMEQAIDKLIAGLVPLGPDYPLPHYRKSA
jgi:hypothetical protein